MWLSQSLENFCLAFPIPGWNRVKADCRWKHVEEIYQCLTCFYSQSFGENLVRVDIRVHERVSDVDKLGSYVLSLTGRHEWILCTASKLDSIIFIIHLFKAPSPYPLKKKDLSVAASGLGCGPRDPLLQRRLFLGALAAFQGTVGI